MAYSDFFIVIILLFGLMVLTAYISTIPEGPDTHTTAQPTEQHQASAEEIKQMQLETERLEAQKRLDEAKAYQAEQAKKREDWLNTVHDEHMNTDNGWGLYVMYDCKHQTVCYRYDSKISCMRGEDTRDLVNQYCNQTVT